MSEKQDGESNLTNGKEGNSVEKSRECLSSSDDDEKPLAIVFPCKDENKQNGDAIKTESSSNVEKDEDDKPLAQIKSKLSITPMVS